MHITLPRYVCGISSEKLFNRNTLGASLSVVLILCAMAVMLWVRPAEQAVEAKGIYEQHYSHFYAEYIKTLPENQARYYADYYATYYANYYSSDEYKAALSYALPAYSDRALRYPVSPVADLYTTSQGIELIKYFEGYRADPYRDAGGKLTIGYGHLLRRGEYYTSLSASEAEALLRQDIELAEAVVKRTVTVPLNHYQFSALVSLVYNIGSHHFETSTLLKKLNNNDTHGAANEFLRWNKVNGTTLQGLVNRREQERALFYGTV